MDRIQHISPLKGELDGLEEQIHTEEISLGETRIVGKIGILKEIVKFEELGIVGDIEIHGKIVLANDGSGLVFEVMEFADDGVFGSEDDDELRICVFIIWFAGH
ncbi:hypothetical protein Tco_0365929 [Tanacetum coccineum]